MKKILRIMSSPRAEYSNSKKLGKKLTEQLLAMHPGSMLIERDLVKAPPPYLQQQHIVSFFKTPADRTSADTDVLAYSDGVVQEVFEADIIVIEAPMYNYGIDARLKSWADQLLRIGVTFGYNAEGKRIGLVQGKEAYIAMSSGGVYSQGEMQGMDFVAPYLRSVLDFIGINNARVVRVEGVLFASLSEQEIAVFGTLNN
jgi:FMN-dependent NADH-azoreductase